MKQLDALPKKRLLATALLLALAQSVAAQESAPAADEDEAAAIFGHARCFRVRDGSVSQDFVLVFSGQIR